ncbi:hypothetical protein Tc00.1047053511431.54 [Trypanosoma cruzi]|uniref:Uncharacterized protein n=1 Tax=Trypanosoma cruzi (strain CL Brener) TaxID=353153 RepID=Q4DGA9_TRYCC|nr:hypothetical protein Tc00.1047053511431.54 [Trypanosoma cruzi]EAN91566.1 hypothetical protein Tc00.1047053511431.54 [Trypanosoma cruzi]|eukprot:XP_813417.1 hypothetical protein [Trypanosoma cruzi strain CL Brener]
MCRMASMYICMHLSCNGYFFSFMYTFVFVFVSPPRLRPNGSITPAFGVEAKKEKKKEETKGLVQMSFLTREKSNNASADSGGSYPPKTKDPLQADIRESVFVSYEERLPQERKSRGRGAKKRSSSGKKMSSHVENANESSSRMNRRDNGDNIVAATRGRCSKDKNRILALSPSQSVPSNELRVPLTSARVLRGSQFSSVAGGGIPTPSSPPSGNEGNGTASGKDPVRMDSTFSLNPEEPLVNFILTEDLPVAPSRR